MIQWITCQLSKIIEEEDVLTINDKVYIDKAIECIRNFFHPFPSVGDTIFWVSAGGIVKKDTFRDNVFCKTNECRTGSVAIRVKN